MSKDDTTRAQDKRRWELPLDFVALTRDEFVQQQEFIRDRAHEILIGILMASKPKSRGVLAWQELALRADAALNRAQAEGGSTDKKSENDEISVTYTTKIPKLPTRETVDA